MPHSTLSTTLLATITLTLAASLPAQDLLQHPLKDLRTLNSYFPFEPPKSIDEWQKRRENLRQHVQVSLGLWPMPKKTPLNPVIQGYGRIDMGDYWIDKVYFESFPGFYVTGNLYRPAIVGGKWPAVLCPHGHFRDGRFRWATDEELAKELESGGEQFESNGRSPLQARCANLAKKGCVVFHYDMLGYADSQQITHELAHGFRTQRPGMNGKDGWGFFSPQAELRLQSIMGLQTWNSIRVLDFLGSLRYVDQDRIGVTGGSGGGTQTFMLCAIDPRPTVAFPAVMVSTAMQGGCTCENCCNLRIAAGNVDFAALFVPKPLGLTAADDWTKEMETKGFPQLKQTWDLFSDGWASQPDVELTARLEFGHNYNQVSRQAMYRFFKRHLDFGGDTTEKEIEVHRPEALTVFNERYLKPDWSTQHEKDLLKHWENAGRLIDGPEKLLYQDQFQEYQSNMRVALNSILSHPKSSVECREKSSANVQFVKTYLKKVHPEKVVGKIPVEIELVEGIMSASDAKSDSQVLFSRKAGVDAQSVNQIMVRIGSADIEEQKKQLAIPDHWDGLFLKPGNTMIVDLQPATFGQDRDSVANPLVPNGREAAGYTFGYNRSVFAWRVSQVLYAIQYLKQQYPNSRITVFARDREFAAIGAIAFAANDDAGELYCELNGFRFADVSSLRDANFFPGAVKYGDVMGFLSMRADAVISLVGENAESIALLQAAIRAAGSFGKVTLLEEPIWE